MPHKIENHPDKDGGEKSLRHEDVGLGEVERVVRNGDRQRHWQPCIEVLCCLTFVLGSILIPILRDLAR